MMTSSLCLKVVNPAVTTSSTRQNIHSTVDILVEFINNLVSETKIALVTNEVVMATSTVAMATSAVAMATK